ncbi:TPR repeat protein [Candidatus Vecturithrix granuli]|uniref:TPR repeat protein n=1 Tax=Vecturithrix granuli TaxID=1499967 RepID=A0A081C0S0_VECG1|nr:TPR repeat protein [Candidatus Vecturithrix granuli]
MRNERINRRTFVTVNIGILWEIGLLCVLTSCAPYPEATGRRPETLPPRPTERQIQEELKRSTAEWAYQQGLQALEREALEEAIQNFELAIQRDAMHLRAYLSLGDAYNMQGEYMIAETYYNKVLYYDPYSVPAYTALANMNAKMGKYREALSLYRKVLELDPANQYAREQSEQVTQELFTSYYDQGIMYKDAGDLDRAVVELQKAYSVAPNLELAIEIGDLYLQSQDYMMADSYFQQALSQDPEYLPAIIGAGKVQMALDHYHEAMNYFKHGVQTQPTNQEAKKLFEQAQTEKVRRTLPPQYTKIFSAEQVTRGEVAALLIVDLNLEQEFPPPSRMVIISDITTHWAKSYIIQAVQFDIMKLPPDRYFRPDEPIVKGELAFVLDGLLGQIGAPLPAAGVVQFHDVSPDNYWYDAIRRTYAAGLIPANSDAEFGINNSVSGQNMQEILAKVKKML